MDGGPESQTNTWNFVQKISHFFKKMKCSKQPNKQNKLNFYFSLRVESQTCAVGGWGPMFGTKYQKKGSFFTPSLIHYIAPNLNLNLNRCLCSDCSDCSQKGLLQLFSALKTLKSKSVTHLIPD